MAYLRPNAFERGVFNKLAMRFGIGGSTRLSVARRDGSTLSIPVIPVEHGGATHLVCPRGEAVWVKRARATGTVELDGATRRAVEVPVAEREPVIAAYRKKAGKTVDRYWKELPDAADHPTFRLEGAA
jgi:hypothetical protein